MISTSWTWIGVLFDKNLSVSRKGQQHMDQTVITLRKKVIRQLNLGIVDCLISNGRTA